MTYNAESHVIQMARSLKGIETHVTFETQSLQGCCWGYKEEVASCAEAKPIRTPLGLKLQPLSQMTSF